MEENVYGNRKKIWEEEGDVEKTRTLENLFKYIYIYSFPTKGNSKLGKKTKKQWILIEEEEETFRRKKKERENVPEKESRERAKEREKERAEMVLFVEWEWRLLSRCMK